jgi:hypothetical protein
MLTYFHFQSRKKDGFVNDRAKESSTALALKAFHHEINALASLKVHVNRHPRLPGLGELRLHVHGILAEDDEILGPGCLL